MAKIDEGFVKSDKMLMELERAIHREYAQAAKEMEEKASRYFAKFAKEDGQMRHEWESGRITKKEYGEWRQRKMLQGEHWRGMRDTLAGHLVNTDKIAMSFVSDKVKDAYALNMNYGTYAIEKVSGINTGFTLINQDAIKVLLKDNPQLLPSPKVNIPKDLRWNTQHINSAITQGILQGESIPKVAKRLQNVTGMDERAAIRNARTAMTGAQNAGRLDSMKRAVARGIAVKKVWIATLDHVTRDSHVDLDGEVVDVDQTFSNGLMYPADGTGAPEEVYNCRCRLGRQYDKHKTDWSNPANRNTTKLNGVSYEDWKKAHKAGADKARAKQAQKKANVILGKNELKAETVAMLRNARKYHIAANGLNETSPDELDDSFFYVNYGKMEDKAANAFTNTIAKLAQEYDTTLNSIRTMDFAEYQMHKNDFAAVFHDYTVDNSTMIINPLKCGDYEKLVDRIKYLAGVNWIPKIDEKLAEQYVATHEFAHTLLDMQTKLQNSSNWLGADYGKIKNVRKEVEKVYSDYLSEVGKVEKAWKENELKFLNAFDMDAAEKARQYKEELDKIYVSKYGMTNSDEFMAECFAHKKLGGNENKYVDRIMDIIDKNFRRK